MARRHDPQLSMALSRRSRGNDRLPAIAGGLFVFGLIAFFIGTAIVSLLSVGGETSGLSIAGDPVVRRVLWFTLEQALLSTLLSVVAAVPVARALARQPQFFGRKFLIRLMAVPMGLPVLIGALGIIGIWGRQGLVNDGLTALGLSERFSIYGLSGILLAHVFFNMPLAARLMLAGLERIPAEYWRTSASLGMGGFSVLRFIEWPVLWRIIPGIAGLIFMLCATSFTLVLVLGGGPAATTIEVAIYQALRLDFEPARAVSLAFLQIVVTAAILGAMALFPAPDDPGATLGGATRRFDARSLSTRIGDGVLIVAAALFLGLPLGQVLVAGLKSDLGRLLSDGAVLDAAATSLAIGLSAAIVSVVVGIAVIRAQAALGAGRRPLPLAGVISAGLAAVSSLVLLVPTAVLGTGWFLVLRAQGDVARFAPAVVVCINALMALPFAMRVLSPAFEEHRRRTARLADSLGIIGLARFRLIDWPVLHRPILTALSFAMALSLGDLGAVALFGSENLVTLPWLIYSRMGAYRSQDADGLALILGLVCLLLALAGTPGLSKKESRDAG